MKPSTERPDACAIGDKVREFVGGAYHDMSIEAAVRLRKKLAEAIAKAKENRDAANA